MNETDLSGQCLEDACVGEVALAWWVYAALAGAGGTAVYLHSHPVHVRLPSWFSSDSGYERYQVGVAAAYGSFRAGERSGYGIMYAHKKRVKSKNSDRTGHKGNKNSDKHSGAQSHGGGQRITPNPNTRNGRNFGND